MFSVTPGDVIYNTLPLYHTAGGALGVGACLVHGNTIALRRKFSASRFWDDCVETKATVCHNDKINYLIYFIVFISFKVNNTLTLN